ncbi:HD domain-containing protein [Candidatus Parcubacteria bacterium]|nr:HD domain-containing protein [Candidatus Parcubacteria bacterium]
MEKAKNQIEIYNNKQESSEDIAREIAQLGDFKEIEKELKEKDLFDKEKARVKKLFNESIDLADFPRKHEAVYELLTIQELYDIDTAEHCVKTYQIAKEKVEKVLSKNIILSRIIEEEGVDLERFYFACLTHDIGKVEIPDFIIKNTVKKDEWDEILVNMIEQGKITKKMLAKLELEPENIPSKDEILTQMKEKHLLAKQIVPVSRAISKEDIEKLENERHISADDSLMDIIDKHAEISERILNEKGFPVAARIVGQHHHKKDEESYPVATTSLQISADIADILHIVDVKQALESARSYKEEYFQIKILKILIEEHVYEEKINSKEVAYLLIKDDYNKLIKQDVFNNLNPEEEGMKKVVDDFIVKFEADDGKYKNDLDSWYEKHNMN